MKFSLFCTNTVINLSQKPTINDPWTSGSPASTNTNVIHHEWHWIVPWKESSSFTFTSNSYHLKMFKYPFLVLFLPFESHELCKNRLTYAIGDANPETAEIVCAQNVGCWSFGHIRLCLIVANHGFCVTPSANEHFNDRTCFVGFAAQN